MGRASTSPTATVFATWFGLDKIGQGKILEVLYRNGGEPMSAARIAECAGISEKSVRPYLSFLRNAMDAESIDTIRGAGWKAKSTFCLTGIGMEECAGALADAEKRGAL